jgi:Toprim domain
MSALPSPTAELARLLSEKTEAVCRHYLSNGRRCGDYWIVGDVGNTPGRSLYVRLRGPSSGKGAAGKWCDAATGEHGDLVDLIRLNRGFESLRETLDEARSFLHVPRPEAEPRTRRESARRNSRQAARRLFAMGRCVIGTPAEAYLRARGITAPLDELCSLRFHPGCYYRAADTGSRETWPALLAAITDLRGNVTAIQRTWLSRDGARKAPIEDPRRSLGHQLGSGVRLGLIDDVLTVGEGLETMLSLRSVLPQMPMLAGLSANHLAALELPFGLRRLYVARDNDAEGRRAETRLRERIQSHRRAWTSALCSRSMPTSTSICAASDLGLCVSGLHASSSRRIVNASPWSRRADSDRWSVRSVRAEDAQFVEPRPPRKIGRAPRAALLETAIAPEAPGRTSRPERGRNGDGRLLSPPCGLLAGLCHTNAGRR